MGCVISIGLYESLQVCRLLKSSSYVSQFLYTYRVIQLVNGVIGVNASAGDFIEQCNCGSKRTIAGGAWHWVLVLIIDLGIRRERLLLYLLAFLNHNVYLVNKFGGLHDFNIWHMTKLLVPKSDLKIFAEQVSGFVSFFYKHCLCN